MTNRDPSIDHEHELFPADRHVEDRSDVLIENPGQPVEQVVGANVDDDGVAHFLRITEEGDACGGCGKEWPCDKRVGVEVIDLPPVAALSAEELAAVRDVLARGQG